MHSHFLYNRPPRRVNIEKHTQTGKTQVIEIDHLTLKRIESPQVTDSGIHWEAMSEAIGLPERYIEASPKDSIRLNFGCRATHTTPTSEILKRFSG